MEPVNTSPNIKSAEIIEEDKKETPKDPIEEVDMSRSVVSSVKKLKTKHSKAFFLVIAFIVVAIGCGGYYLIASLMPSEEITYNPLVITEEVSTDPIFDKDTLPRIDASESAQSLATAFIKNFTAKDSIDEFEINYTDTNTAYSRLISNEVDAIIVTTPSDSVMSQAAAANTELKIEKIADDALVFFVNNENPVSSAYIYHIKQIYNGEITNWKEIGGDDAEIIAYQLPDDTSAQQALLSTVTDKKHLRAPKDEEISDLNYSNIIEKVKDNKYAIGFGIHHQIDESNTEGIVKYLTIDNISPNGHTISNTTYPVPVEYYLVTRQNDTNPELEKLRENIFAARGQKVSLEAKYNPVVIDSNNK